VERRTQEQPTGVGHWKVEFIASQSRAIHPWRPSLTFRSALRHCSRSFRGTSSELVDLQVVQLVICSSSYSCCLSYCIVIFVTARDAFSRIDVRSDNDAMNDRVRRRHVKHLIFTL